MSVKEKCKVTVLPSGTELECTAGENLYALLRGAGLAPEAFCGGNGKCGKCTVRMDGENVLSCRTAVTGDITVSIPQRDGINVLTEKNTVGVGELSGLRAAFDIGTTTVVCFLTDGNGRLLASAGELNPQVVYGADVVSRIRSAMSGSCREQGRLIRNCMCELLRRVCAQVGAECESIGLVSVVGNPTMQQLFLGLDVSNLVTIPFSPALTHAESVPAGEYLPVCPSAELLIVPDVSGYIGADTVGCILSTEMYKTDALTLMIDIGTNGEMVLGNRERLLSCATAAGPALEGANIRCGMRGAYGAIDRVYIENGEIRCHVIGETAAKGICGSGLIDAAAVLLALGRLDKRGHILPRGCERIELADGVFLTQEDIRELQLAKGAIAAGILLLAKNFGVETADIERVCLAGAFGSFLSAKNACRIGLIPPELEGKIETVGNAAGAGARLIGQNRENFMRTEDIVQRTELMELASQPDFQRCFAKNMYFFSA